MALKILPPLVTEFVLSETDQEFKNEGSPTMISLRAAAKGEDEARNKLFAMVAREYGADDSVTITSPISVDDVKRKEIYLTLAACNITDINEKPLFKFKGNRLDMTERDFEFAWGGLPQLVADEMIKCSGIANPQWTPEGKA